MTPGIAATTAPGTGAHTAHDRDGSRSATAVGMGALGMATSFVPSAYARPARTQAISALLMGGIGAGIGAAAHPGVALVGDGDPVRGGAMLAAGGLGLFAVTRLLPIGRGGGLAASAAGDLALASGSLGMLAAGAGAAAAVTTLTQREDASLLDQVDNALPGGRGTVAAAAGGALGAVLFGALAITGRLHGAPTAVQAARTTVVLDPAVASTLTPQLSREAHAARLATAKAEYLKLPSATVAAWANLKDGRSFLAGVASGSEIESAMGIRPLREARRVFVGEHEAPTAQARALLALERLDAAGMTDYSNINIVSLTADGGTNFVVPMAVENGALGDSISVAIQHSAVDAKLALHKLPAANRAMGTLVDGIAARLRALPPDQPPPTVLFTAYCYGGLASQRTLLSSGGPLGMQARGVDHAAFMGVPGLDYFARMQVGKALRKPELGAVVAESGADLERIAASRAAAGEAPPAVTHLVHEDDGFRAGLHTMLVPLGQLGPGRRRPFVPIVTAINTYLDLGSQSFPAHQLREVGHEFEGEGTRIVQASFGFDFTPKQRAAIDQQAVLRGHQRMLATSDRAPEASSMSGG